MIIKPLKFKGEEFKIRIPKKKTSRYYKKRINEWKRDTLRGGGI